MLKCVCNPKFQILCTLVLIGNAVLLFNSITFEALNFNTDNMYFINGYVQSTFCMIDYNSTRVILIINRNCSSFILFVLPQEVIYHTRFSCSA